MLSRSNVGAIPGRVPLLLAASASALIALLHILIPFLGPEAYRFFGAPALATAAERGSVVRPAAMTFAFAIIFAIWALLAASAAGLVRRLPLLRTGLVAIAVVYLLRGLLFLTPQLLLLLAGKHQAPQAVAFSAAALLIGLCYLTGVVRAWAGLTPHRSHAA